MNLTTEPWIPVVRMDWKPGTASLREVSERGHEIQDLAVRVLHDSLDVTSLIWPSLGGVSAICSI